MSLLVRRAAAQDCDDFCRIMQQVHDLHVVERPDFYRNGRAMAAEEFEAMLGDPSKLALVAVFDDCVAGICEAQFREASKNPIVVPRRTVWVDALAVDEKCRGKGIGTALYNAVMSEARSFGTKAVTLNVWTFNRSACNFYKKLGFEEQRIVMEKKV
ncbi:MAG: GNAT family N-acetyltransferase [Clostridiaceae bacterium]|nr:GNAT family N-acetyltransferase [Clostridiaceae bacterium]